MLYAYFKNKQFVKFLLNFNYDDPDFFINLVNSMGHNASEVQIVPFRRSLRNDEIFTFDENLDMIIMSPEEVQVEVEIGGDKVFETRTVFKTSEKIQKDFMKASRR